MIDLNDTERDALTRLADIGIAKASAALAKLVGSEVRMSMPRLDVTSRADAARGLEGAFSDRLVAVSERFDGPLRGAALLVFAEGGHLDLVRAVLPDEIDPADVPELEDEALTEVGNIILNNWLAAVANALDAGLSTALPQVLRGSGAALFDGCGVPGGEEAPTLVFAIRFQVQDRNISGQILIAMDASSEAALRDRITRSMTKIAG